MLARLVIFAAVSTAIYLGAALGLILSQPAGRGRAGDESRGEASGETLDFSRLPGDGAAEPLPRIETRTRLGEIYAPGHLPAPVGKPLVIMLHGSGWHGGQFAGLARALEGQAEILTPSLRGHFGGPGARRGDVDHVGQFEEDLADLIRAHAAPGQRVVLVGHSSGGGLAIRMAGGPPGAMVDRVILLAPFLQHNAPTMRPNSGGWAQPLTRRIVGLSMLNMAGIHLLDHLTAITLNMPRQILDGPLGDQATTAYSWRLNLSYAPHRDWKADVAALPPFLLIAGAEDEAFLAPAYEPTLSPLNPGGDYLLVPGRGHLDIVAAPETVAALGGVLQ